ncbi:MAG: tripartite tricarboxylate transporter TctB family protein [Desulfobacterales bacterium]|jgi:putative tricarboxylic transport membrane protein|nr:tripartite tricarboxylate transporter TctB family protein [Desulfobacterales bacterium]
MRRVNQVGSLLFFVGALSVMWASWALEYYTPLGPGPGFFPLWLGGCLALLSLIWFVQAGRKPREPIPEGFIPARDGMMRIGSILGALLLMGLLIDVLGFQLMMFAFLLFLLVVLGRRSIVLTLAISLAGSFGAYYAFTTWLGVQLPQASISWLMKLGL